MLNNKKLEAAKPKDKLYKLSDEAGLYIAVLKTGAKSWRCDYVINGKRKTHTFGLYPVISIAEARSLNIVFKSNLITGNETTCRTFDEVKRDWFLHKLPTLKNIKHQKQVINRIDTHASPTLGKMAINTIKRADLVKVVQDVQKKKIIETAHRVAMHLRQLFDYCVDIGEIESHPANNLGRILQTPKVKHMACIAVDDAPALFEKIQTIEEPVNRLGLIFVALTFVRASEMRFMRWTEIVDKRFWVISAERMKGKFGKRKPHVVPLSDFALSVLKQLEAINGDYEFAFQSPVKPNKPMSENCLLDALYGIGYRHKMTVHGFRALASTILNEQSSFKRDVIERQLAHKETDAVRAAYNRAEYLDERIKLMNWWSDQVCAFLK